MSPLITENAQSLSPEALETELAVPEQPSSPPLREKALCRNVRQRGLSKSTPQINPSAGPLFKTDVYSAIKVRAASMLALGMRLSEISAKLGIHRNTLANWMREDEGFALMCGETLSRIRDEIRVSATGAYMDALEILRDLAEASIKPADRIKACTAILQYTSPMVNADRINPPPAEVSKSEE